MVTKNLSKFIKAASFIGMGLCAYNVQPSCPFEFTALPPQLESIPIVEPMIKPSYKILDFNNINMVFNRISKIPCKRYFDLISAFPSTKLKSSYSSYGFLKIKHLITELWMDDRLKSIGILPPLTEDIICKIEMFLETFFRYARETVPTEMLNYINGDMNFSDDTIKLINRALKRLEKAGVTDITNIQGLFKYLSEKFIADVAIILLKDQQVKELIISVLSWLKDNKDTLSYSEDSLVMFLMDPFNFELGLFKDYETKTSLERYVYKFLNSLSDIVNQFVSFNKLPSNGQIHNLILPWFKIPWREADLSSVYSPLFSILTSINLDSMVFEDKDLFEIQKSLSILFHFMDLKGFYKFHRHNISSPYSDINPDRAIKSIISAIYTLPFSYDQINNDFYHVLND